MRYKVYHVIEPTFRPTVPKDFPNGFELVAELVIDSYEIGNLEKVFELTNTIEHPWWNNKEVKVHRKTRSTSVGDVVQTEEGRFYLCDAAGWTQFFRKPTAEEIRDAEIEQESDPYEGIDLTPSN